MVGPIQDNVDVVLAREICGRSSNGTDKSMAAFWNSCSGLLAPGDLFAVSDACFDICCWMKFWIQNGVKK